ncbi:MAG TPA: hypothetical protein EYP62_00875 [Kiritimatiellae bacterium]|nr:hypothetical protein [Kiritimatiellia bacterium]
MIAALNALGRRGITWCTNSGRNFEDQAEILRRAVADGLQAVPDAVMFNEAYIRSFDGDELPAWRAWNAAARQSLREFQPRVQAVLRRRLDQWGSAYRILRAVLEEDATAFLVSNEGDLAARFAAELSAALVSVPGAVVLRNGGWVAVLPSHLGKGWVLAAYMRSRSLEPDEVLAIGDQLNDISMLNGRVTDAIGCPSDAAAEVKSVVMRAGGIVAARPGYLGTLELLERFCGIGTSRSGGHL